MTPSRVLLNATHRDWLKSIARGNPWVIQQPRRPAEIAALISPLRFDILVRASYFEFYADRRDLYRADFKAFASRARGHSYFHWFRDVMCVNWQPHVLANAQDFEAAWEARLRAAAELHDSFEARGFDTRFPITLYAARRVRPTESGKRVSRSLYAGDGNHRLALLLASGEQSLSPAYYRIKRFRHLAPPDTTPIMLDALRPSVDQYLDFVEMGYPSIRVERVDHGFELAHTSDERLRKEVGQLLDVDSANLDMEST
jgi:hypothetical protein